MGKFHPLSNQTEEWNGTNWSEGPAIDVGSAGRRSDAGGCAPNTMYIIGGYTPGGVPYFTTFNGTNFTAEPNMPSVKQNVRNFHAGNSPSAIAAGGAGGGCCTNVWNGSSWSEVGALPFKAEGNTGAGTVNDAYSYGGRRSNAPTYPGAVEGCTDTFIAWDGTSWSEITAGTPIPTYAPYAGVRSAIGTGTGASEVFVFGGKNMRSPSTYEWAATSASLAFQSHISSASFGRLEFSKISGDGTNLKSSLPYSPGLLSSSKQIAANISGSFNKGFGFSGEISGSIESTGSFGRLDGGVLIGDATTLTSSINYNGLVTGSAQIASRISGSFNKGFTFTGAIKAEEASWAAGGCLIQERWALGGVGSVNAAIAVGGQCGPHTHHNTPYALTEQYDGTSFTEVNDMINASTGTAAGQYNNAYFHKLYNGNDTENWNGTNWSAGHVNPTTANQYIGGSTPSELYVIGSLSNCGNFFSDYNVTGGTFAVCTAVPFTFGYAAGAFGHSGDMTAGIVSSGWTNPTNPNIVQETVIWNGSTWSDAASQLIPYPARAGWSGHKQGGTVNASFMVGGQSAPPSGPSYQAVDSVHVVNAFQNWDGTSWSVKAEIPQVHYDHAAVGTPQAALFFGGLASTPVAPVYRHIRSGSFNYEDDLTTGSFGRLEFISASGDALGLQSSITYVTNPSFNVLTGSSQIASEISGSFTSGFDYSGLMGKARGGVFASSTNMLDIHTGGNGGSMLQGTAIVAGGSYGGGWPPSTTDNTQVYNGTSWTEVNNLTSGVRSNDTLGLAGDSSAALFFGGPVGPGATEEWNGTNWTEVADIPDNASSGAGAGGESSESAIWVNYFGGRGNKWDGTAWSEINNLNFPRYDGNSTGTRDEHFVVGGSSPAGAPTYPYNLCSEVFNGTNWTAVADVITPLIQAFGMGTYNDAIFAGGWDAPSGHLACNHTQTFDGTSWASGPNIVNRRRAESAGSKYSGPAAGGATNAAYFAGGSPGYPTYNSSATEVFPGFVVSASFGRLEAGKILGDATGIQSSLPYPSGTVSGSAQLASNISGSFNKGFGFSGEISGSVTSTGSFGLLTADFIHGDGTSLSGSLIRNTGLVSGSKQLAANISGSFTSGFGYEGTIQTKFGGAFSLGASIGRRVRYTSGLGSVNAAMVMGGNDVHTPTILTEEYDGSSWSEGGELPEASSRGGASGTVNAGIYFGGFGGSESGDGTYTYNGTNWSETTDLPGNSVTDTVGAGSNQGAALAMIGTSDNQLNDAYEWNGSNWSEISEIGTNRGRNQGGGESTEAAIVVGGDDTPSCIKTNQTEIWNGTNWTEVNDTIHPVRYNSFAGTTNDGIVMGGLTTPYSQASQLWDGTTWSETSTLIFDAFAPAASGRVGVGALAGGAHKFGGGTFSTPSSEIFSAFISSASFHNIEATTLVGDGSSLSASLQTQILTSVTQISNSISGSFNKGFDLQGGVSASLGLYGGTWSEVNPLNQARTGGAVGNKAAALASAGRPPGGAPYASTCTELWNGVNWSVATARSNVGGGTSIAGNSEAAVSHQIPSTANYTEIWNGTSWSEGSTGNSHQIGDTDMVGTVDAAIEAGGFNASSQVQSDAAEWNGSTWSEATALPAARAGGSFAGIQNDAMYSGGTLSTGIVSSTLLYDGSSWSAGVPLPILSYRQAGDGSSNSSIHAGAHPASPGAWPQYNAYQFGGLAWYRVADLTRTPASAFDGDIAGDPRGALAVGGYIVNNTEEFSSYGNDSSGSFHNLRGTVGGEIKTNMFMVSGSTMKLPLFSDQDINYWNNEPQESTGSMSGSVVRAGDVNLLNKPGNFFFHSDHNALGFTYVSASVYSQSVDFVTCQYASGGLYTSSQGFITQSHYCYKNVIQYITGSYT